MKVGPDGLAECKIPVPVRPGVLAEVTTVLGELGVNIWDLEIAYPVESERGELLFTIGAHHGAQVQSTLKARGYEPFIRRRP